ncbi:hypothetical protein CO174_03685 [Candidatus Uhrbacteria bacterium CG_4_9_14_3_um_filter_50_9]|uniref:Uncharacterized protein n=1 Tax=Candidatus Uhrbacteria bacterium CG_4_9_14_3_um_filter_50_9 TaxID=1975035 RepID=A0A2M7XBQ8_9BACT|nr:MAG: hypothetical protein CO174_03685 [Candidatus Uhrbacteria bacterium CG_4_9_14_3_um_filter_50_9]
MYLNVVKEVHVSTHNIARTLVEGGHRGDWNFNCRESTRAERRNWNKACRRLAQDQDSWDETNIEERWSAGARHYEYSSNHYCSYTRRFLESRVGQPWDKIFSELCWTFDRRNFVNWVLIDRRMLDDVGEDSKRLSQWASRNPSPGEMYIDEDGILRKMPRRQNSRWRMCTREEEREIDRQAGDWLDGRKVGQVGNILFWFVEASMPHNHCCVIEPAYRQDLPLTGKDLDVFENLPLWKRRKLLKDAPVLSQANAA